jgi:hypothetical protein
MDGQRRAGGPQDLVAVQERRVALALEIGGRDPGTPGSQVAQRIVAAQRVGDLHNQRPRQLVEG